MAVRAGGPFACPGDHLRRERFRRRYRGKVRMGEPIDPDADLDAFVDDFARRVASFEKRALELAKKLVNARAGVPSEADRWGSNQSFIGTTSWPETKAVVAKLMDKGLQKEGDFELRLGHYVGHVAR